MTSKMQVMESLSLLSAVFEDVVRAVGNLEAQYEDVGDSAKLSAVASELEGLEEDFSEIERVVRGYLNSSPNHSVSLNGSRTTPTGQSAIKEQSERLKEEISRREHELKQVVDILEKTYEECHKKLEERLSQEQVAKEQDLGGKKVVVDRPCERVRELVEQREKVEDVTVPEPPLRDQNTPRVQMTTVKEPPSAPCSLFTDLPTLIPATVNSMAASFSPLSVYSSTPIVSQASVSQMTTIGGQLPYQQQPLSTVVNSIQTMPVQTSTVLPPIVSSHRICETAARTHTDVQPVLSRNQFQSTPGTGQSLNSTNDHLSIDSSAALKRVSIPKFAGNKKHYEAWKAAFYSCVDRARATPEYKLLRLRECLQGEALKVIENLGHSAAAYEAAKSRLERKYGGKRRALTLRLEELEAFKQIREGNEKDLEKFAELLDALVVNLTDAKQEAELGNYNGSLYITLQRKFNKNLLAKYKQWICNSGTSEEVNALREFIDRESEFMTAASETIAGVLKDETKRERTFLTEEDHSSKKKPTKKCELCRDHHGLWKCENFKKMTANERWNVATEHKLCFRCLSDGPHGESCFRSKTCGINGCRSHHHRMLHAEPAPRVNTEEQLRVDPPNALTSVTSGPAREGEPTERTHTTTTGVEPTPSTKFAALRTVPVYLTSGKRKVKVNALLDDGSSKTYLNSDIAAELELKGSPHVLTVNVLNDNQEKFETTVVEFTISSLNGRVSKLASAYTTEKVTGNMEVVNWRCAYGISPSGNTCKASSFFK